MSARRWSGAPHLPWLRLAQTSQHVLMHFMRVSLTVCVMSQSLTFMWLTRRHASLAASCHCCCKPLPQHIRVCRQPGGTQLQHDDIGLKCVARLCKQFLKLVRLASEPVTCPWIVSIMRVMQALSVLIKTTMRHVSSKLLVPSEHDILTCKHADSRHAT